MSEHKHHTGPKTEAGKAASSRNAERHGLTNFQPVVTAADRPEYDAMRLNLHLSIRPNSYLQQIAFERLVNACWNMQRALKLENEIREAIGDLDPMAVAEHIKLAELYHRYYLRNDGAYRATLREIERLQKLDLASAIHFNALAFQLGDLVDVREFQRHAKRKCALIAQ